MSLQAIFQNIEYLGTLLLAIAAFIGLLLNWLFNRHQLFELNRQNRFLKEQINVLENNNGPDILIRKLKFNGNKIKFNISNLGHSTARFIGIKCELRHNVTEKDMQFNGVFTPYFHIKDTIYFVEDTVTFLFYPSSSTLFPNHSFSGEIEPIFSVKKEGNTGDNDLTHLRMSKLLNYLAEELNQRNDKDESITITFYLVYKNKLGHNQNFTTLLQFEFKPKKEVSLEQELNKKLKRGPVVSEVNPSQEELYYTYQPSKLYEDTLNEFEKDDIEKFIKQHTKYLNKIKYKLANVFHRSN